MRAGPNPPEVRNAHGAELAGEPLFDGSSSEAEFWKGAHASTPSVSSSEAIAPDLSDDLHDQEIR